MQPEPPEQPEDTGLSPRERNAKVLESLRPGDVIQSADANERLVVTASDSEGVHATIQFGDLAGRPGAATIDSKYLGTLNGGYDVYPAGSLRAKKAAEIAAIEEALIPGTILITRADTEYRIVRIHDNQFLVCNTRRDRKDVEVKLGIDALRARNYDWILGVDPNNTEPDTAIDTIREELASVLRMPRDATIAKSVAEDSEAVAPETIEQQLDSLTPGCVVTFSNGLKYYIGDLREDGRFDAESQASDRNEKPGSVPKRGTVPRGVNKETFLTFANKHDLSITVEFPAPDDNSLDDILPELRSDIIAELGPGASREDIERSKDPRQRILELAPGDRIISVRKPDKERRITKRTPTFVDYEKYDAGIKTNERPSIPLTDFINGLLHHTIIPAAQGETNEALLRNLRPGDILVMMSGVILRVASRAPIGDGHDARIGFEMTDINEHSGKTTTSEQAMSLSKFLLLERENQIGRIIPAVRTA